ncbi:hypothetical protein BKA65DRAFT_563649 [Rhexocercosporidium sp. MPI-PUGE-AT-0058]|nr:hypothetical protein BKA65DRAFT_563649 [Rhexocercosporidium sp. MPI-PUGE-AT-0058]
MFALFAQTSKFYAYHRLDITARLPDFSTSANELFTAPKVPTVMLLSNYGVSTLGKTLRRPRYLMTTMNSLDGNSGATASASTENMRSIAARMGGRALSTPVRANSSPTQNRTWSPNNGIVFSGSWNPNQGIVFKPAAGTSRSLSTNDVAGIHQVQLLHSQVEDEYVVASADTNVLERQLTVTSKATASADSKEKTMSTPRKLKDMKVPKTPKTKDAEKKLMDTKAPGTTPEAGELNQDGISETSLKDSKAKDPKDPETSVSEPEPKSEPEDPSQNELPRTTTTLKMTEDLFRKAKNAEVGSPESYWSHSLYRGPMMKDGKLQRTTVHYCKSILTTERVLKMYFAESKVIGFDIEWKESAHRNSSAKENVSLILIANEERIALFHIALYPKHELVSPAFKKLMEDDQITKVGVSIKADCTRLRKHLGIETRGILELSHLYKLVKYSSSGAFKEINRRLVSLAKQTQEHLHLPMFKGDVRVSDWSRALNLDQLMYAASDSYAGLQLFHTLEMKRKELDPTPPRPYHAELNLPIRLAEGVEIPSDAEAEEAEPEVEDLAENTTTKPKSKKSSQRELEAAKETVSLEDPELEYALTGHTPSLSPDPSPAGPFLIRRIAPHAPASSKPPALFSSYTSSLVHAAETLASCHLDSVHKHPGRANPHHPLHSSSKSTYHLRGRNLRTYFLWYENPDLSLEEVGALLRKPALSGRSVAVGILEAVRVEGVPFDRERLRGVIAKWRMWGNRWVVNTRYGRLEEECGFVVGGEGEEKEGQGEKA